MDDHKPDDTVKDWLERARRAHDLVDRVDLDSVVAHNPEEVEKMNKVADALVELSDGHNVAYIPGVDPDNLPIMNVKKDRVSELTRVLTAAGLSDRLGYVRVDDEEAPIATLESIPHRDGLPEFDLCVAPEKAPPDGALSIFVSERGVFAALIPEPVTRHKWRIVRSHPFEDATEMLETVRGFMATV